MQNPQALKRTQKLLLILTMSVALAAACVAFWLYSQRYVSTDDAYLNANVVDIVSRVSGQVAHLYVIENQYVEKNKPLFELDEAPFKIAIEKAKAQLAIDEATLQNAIVTSQRIESLVKTRVLAPQLGDDVKAKLETTKAAIKLGKDNLDQAKQNLEYARIYSPSDGWVTNVKLQEGDIIKENQPVFALITNGEFWLDANFRETELNKIKPGMRAKVKLDMYPGVIFQGWVESVSDRRGTAGNKVKITQQVPVRVRVNNKDSRYPLRIGTSGIVTIDLQSDISK